MDSRKFEIIQQLMDQLKDEMEYSPQDMEERLGRKKPDAMIMIKAEKDGKPMDDAMEKAEESSGMDLDDDNEMGEDPMHAAKVMGGDDSGDMNDEDEMFKQRLMGLRR